MRGKSLMESGAGILSSAAGVLLFLVLAGCSERYITTADDTVLVVVDRVVGKNPKTAQVHFTFAEPQSLDEAGSEQVVAMEYEAVFDCDKKIWGQSAQHLTTQSGETVSHLFPTPTLEAATPDSIAASILASVCNPGGPSSRRPLTAIQKDYLKRMGGLAAT